MVVGNVTGWNTLLTGNIPKAIYEMYDYSFGGWFIVILFFIFQFMLLMKTRSWTLSFISSIFFVGLMAGSIYIKAYAMQFVVTALALELAGIAYLWFMSR